MARQPGGGAEKEIRLLLDAFADAGAAPVEVDVLQPASLLLDLYGENIRSRAYVTHDPYRGELMLRPDFTVPVIQKHAQSGAERARYAYCGAVFRKPDADSQTPPEHIQVGFEVFEASDPERLDAEVFCLFARALSGAGLSSSIGDLALVRAAVDGLGATRDRREALLRHLWRPRRFRELLGRFSGRADPPEARMALLGRLGEASAEELIGAQSGFIGMRSREEILERVSALREDALARPIDPGLVSALEGLLDIKAPLPEAIALMRAAESRLPSIGPAVDRIEARAKAMESLGAKAPEIQFEASFERTKLEYYDGFVFGFHASGRPGLPVVASGGRYDALTGAVAGTAGFPAVGGVVRPQALAELRGGAR